MLDLKTSEIHGNEMVGGRPEILQAGRIDPSSERGGQGVQGADHETAIESSEIPGENEAVNEVTETEELPEGIGIETETVKYPARPRSGLKKIVVKNVVVNEVTETEELPEETETVKYPARPRSGLKKIVVKNVVVNEVTETEELPEEIGIEGKGTGNGIGQEVVLPKGIQPVPANRPVLVTATNTKRVNEKKEREVKIRTETTSKKR